MITNTNSKIIIFQTKRIRSVWHKDEWWFVITDVVEVLADTTKPAGYLKNMRRRDQQLFKDITDKVMPLFVETVGGRQNLNCANTEGVLRLIQSIPSQKAEPFKRWLAKLGKERLDEIENPELAQERMKKMYKQKGYSKDWIDKRLRGISVRQNLTDEWNERGVTKQSDYAILTSEISKATFGMSPNEYKKFKGIPQKSKQNLRDNMTDLELIFTMLGEKMTTEISKEEKPSEMPEHKEVAKRGGTVAGKSKSIAEEELGRSVISKKVQANSKKIK